MYDTGKLVFAAGIIIAFAGGLMMLSGKLSWLGKLPGDVMVRGKNFTFYFPIATSILLSLLLTLLLWLFGRR